VTPGVKDPDEQTGTANILVSLAGAGNSVDIMDPATGHVLATKTAAPGRSKGLPVTY